MADTPAQMREMIQQALENEDAQLAAQVIRQLSVSLPAARNETQREAILRVMARLRLVAIRYAEASDLEATLINNPVEFLSGAKNADPVEKLRYFISLEPYADDREELRKRLRSALAFSQQLFGPDTISLGDRAVPATVENWIKLYVSFMGNARATTVQLAKLFTDNQDVQALSDPAKEVLKKMYRLYEFFRLSSEDLGGYEENEIIEDNLGTVYSIDEGELFPLFTEEHLKEYERQAKKQELNLEELVYLKTKFPERFDQYTVKFEGNIQDLIPEGALEQQTAEFFEEQAKEHALPQPQKPIPSDVKAQIQAFLLEVQRSSAIHLAFTVELLKRVSSNKNSLSTFLSHPEIHKFIQKQFPASLGQKNKDLLNQTAMIPVAFQALLQIVFEKVYSLPPEQSLWYAHEICRQVPVELTEFKTVATYDLKENKIVWRY